MEPRIDEKREIKIVGNVSYGGNIGELWSAFEENKNDIKHKVPNSYWELHIYPKNFTGKEKYHIMVGVEVLHFKSIPIEMFTKALPECTYAIFTHKLANSGWEGSNERIDKWLDESEKYTRALPIDIQYFDNRFKGPDDPESILDFYIPIKRKE